MITVLRKSIFLSCILFGGEFCLVAEAKAECKWTAQWRNQSTKSDKTFQLTAENGAQFGIETDFLCIVSPVSVMSASNEDGKAPIKHVDMNCRYAEGERGMATGLAGIEADFAMEVVHFFLTDQVGDTAHSITLKMFCEPVGEVKAADDQSAEPLVTPTVSGSEPRPN